MKHIARFTYGNSGFNGFRVMVRRGGHLFVKYFSVAAYGSVDDAQEEAIRFRDALLEILKPVPKGTSLRWAKARGADHSFGSIWFSQGYGDTGSWCVRAGGEQHKFTVSTHGAEKAREMAVAILMEHNPGTPDEMERVLETAKAFTDTYDTKPE